jgi:hypothetical protein
MPYNPPLNTDSVFQCGNCVIIKVRLQSSVTHAVKEFRSTTRKQAVKKDACLPQAERTLVLLNFKLELCKRV